MKNFEKIRNVCKICIIGLVPLICCYVYCLLCGGAGKLSSVYLPNSLWNDELLYYKQIEGIVKYGMPAGFYGYNESCASVGTLGAWSPVLYIPYVFWGKIFGWNFSSPIYFNLILSCAACLFFYVVLKPQVKEWALYLGLCSFYLPFTRYILSGVPESLINSLLLVVGTLILYINKKPSSSPICYVVLNILIFFLTLCRPYYAVLFVAAIIISKFEKKRWIFFIQISLIILSLIVYFLISKEFCASYFFSLINLDWIKLIIISPQNGIPNALFIFLSSLYSFLHLAGEGIVNGGFCGGWAAMFFLCFIWLIYRVIKSENNFFWLYWVVTLFLIVASDFFLYDVTVGTRHLMGVTLLVFVFFAYYEKNVKIIWFSVLITFWIFIMRGNDSYNSNLAIRSWDTSEIINYGTDILAEGIKVYEEADGWDNTVIWSLSSRWQELYALPEGVGINVCQDEYIIENFDNLKSKYLAVVKDGTLDMFCDEKSNADLIAEYGNTRIYELR